MRFNYLMDWRIFISKDQGEPVQKDKQFVDHGGNYQCYLERPLLIRNIYTKKYDHNTVKENLEWISIHEGEPQ